VQDNAKTSKPDNLIKKPAVCQKLAISKRTLDYKLSRNELPHVRIGGSVRFLESDIDNYIASNRVKARGDRAARKAKA
jgi:excisionase family DNA binding protein